jgi:hypothetical protein
VRQKVLRFIFDNEL